MKRHDWRRILDPSERPMLLDYGTVWYKCRRCGWCGTLALGSGPKAKDDSPYCSTIAPGHKCHDAAR
jgi:hypothetical protein